MILLSIHSLLAFVLPLVLADVEFTSPAAGSDVPVGKINVQWEDSGKAPVIADLTLYTLNLMVGGNDAADMTVVQSIKPGGNFNQGNEVGGLIAAGVAESIPNGFFFQMISTSSTGGTVINYSDRFTITGLNGQTDTEYRNAVAALNGDTSGPPRSGNAIPSGSSASVQASSSTTSTKLPETVTVTDTGNSNTAAPAASGSVSDSGSNVGVIAGAVLGCLAFLIATAGFGIWACMRRKKQQQDRTQQLDDKDEGSPQRSVELAKQPSIVTKPSITQLSELSAEGRVLEIGDGIPPPELDSNNVRAELAGDFFYEHTCSPLTPISPSLYGEETLNPTLPRSGF